MVTLREAINNQVRASFCTAVTLAENGVSLGENLFLQSRGIGLGPTPAELANNLRGLQGLACDFKPGIGADTFEPPFTGGQCDFILYDVQYPYTVTNGPDGPEQTFTQNTAAYGPIGGVSLGPGANQASLTGAIGPGDPATTNLDLQVNPPFILRSVGSLTVTPRDSVPDTCGDPPPEPPGFDPDNFQDNVDLNFDGPDGTPQTEPVGIQFRPVILGPGGEFNAPFSIDFDDGSSLIGEFNLNIGEVNISPNINFGGGSGSGGFEGDPDQDPEEVGLVVIGVRVISGVNRQVVKATEIAQTPPQPNIWAPKLGYVNFKYETNAGGQSWGRDIPVKNTNFVVWADRPAVNVAGTPENGVVFTVIPIVKLIDPSQCDPDCC